ncbi:Pectinesterase [Handroanthus impetiginosus]|uniref:Pectinesterase n=1 Tax=Handroanthus impetiginosus TaxID=429701 RepID=A0A2G9HC89_9LAMI|nr:Pectinesterase [Handroanthus impetiginosus]
MNTMDQSQVTLLENQSSRKKTKQFFILFFIIIFTLIISVIISAFTVLKLPAQSQSLSTKVIVMTLQTACRVTHQYYPCNRSLPSLQNHTHKIHPSNTVGFSIRSVFHEVSTISTLPQKLASKIDNNNIKPALIDCHNLLIDSLNQLNRSQNVEIVVYDEEMVKNLRVLMAQVKKKIGRCLDGLDAAAAAAEPQQIVRMKKVTMRIKKAEIYVLNSLEILEKMGKIYEISDPNFGSILGSFMLYGVGSFCLQYLAMVLLFCVLIVRVFMLRK